MHLSSINIKFLFNIIVVNLSCFLSGALSQWPTVLVSKLSSSENPLHRTITSQEQTWIFALPSLGGCVGVILTGAIQAKLGRKPAFIYIHIINVIATALPIFEGNIVCIYVSRIIAGISVYAAISVTAVYFVEICHSPTTRGSIFSTAFVNFNLGILLCCSVGPQLSIRNFSLILLGVSCISLILTLIAIQESPYYLVEKGRTNRARLCLQQLRGSVDVLKEIKTIEEYVARNSNKGLSAMCMDKTVRKPLSISLMLIVMQHFSGASVIFFYTETIFERAGSGIVYPLSRITIGLIQFVSSFVTTFGVDRFGRKKMLEFSSAGLAFVLGILATYFRFREKTGDNPSIIDWLPLPCLILFVIFYNSGMGSVPFLCMAEVLPLNFKSLSSTLVMASYCVINFLTVFFYGNLADEVGTSGCFYIFAVVMLSYALLVVLYLFETAGKTIQEIDKRFGLSKRTENAFETNNK